MVPVQDKALLLDKDRHHSQVNLMRLQLNLLVNLLQMVLHQILRIHIHDGDHGVRHDDVHQKSFLLLYAG
jgi:hypothetical protein